MDLSINFDFFETVEIYNQFHSQKLKNYFCTLNKLFRNLLTTQIPQNLETQTQAFLGRYV